MVEKGLNKNTESNLSTMRLCRDNSQKHNTHTRIQQTASISLKLWDFHSNVGGFEPRVHKS